MVAYPLSSRLIPSLQSTVFQCSLNANYHLPLKPGLPCCLVCPPFRVPDVFPHLYPGLDSPATLSPPPLLLFLSSSLPIFFLTLFHHHLQSFLITLSYKTKVLKKSTTNSCHANLFYPPYTSIPECLILRPPVVHNCTSSSSVLYL